MKNVLVKRSSVVSNAEVFAIQESQMASWKNNPYVAHVDSTRPKNQWIDSLSSSDYKIELW